MSSSHITYSISVRHWGLSRQLRATLRHLRGRRYIPLASCLMTSWQTRFQDHFEPFFLSILSGLLLRAAATMLQTLLRRVPVRLLVLVGLSLFILFYQNPSTAYLPHFEDPARISRYFNKSKWSPISLDRLSSLASGVTLAEFPTSPLCPNATATTVTMQMSCPTQASPGLQFQVPEKQSTSKDSAPLAEQQIMNHMREEGIVIIFKTGAQEVSKLAIHIGTTLRFFDQEDILFFSDLHDTLGPFTIHDALRNVDQSIRKHHPEFEIYRNLQKYHSTGQDIQKLAEGQEKGNDRSGWILDKWKFLHMVEETFEMRPNAKWYVFMETDSYVAWPNLVAFLRRYDHTKPLYMGKFM